LRRSDFSDPSPRIPREEFASRRWIRRTCPHGHNIFVITVIGYTLGKGWVELDTNADDRERLYFIINIITTVNCYKIHSTLFILWLSGLQVGGMRWVYKNSSVYRSVPPYRDCKSHTSTILHYTKRICRDGRLRARGAWLLLVDTTREIHDWTRL